MNNDKLSQFAEEIQPLLSQYHKEQINLTEQVISKCLYKSNEEFRKMEEFVVCMQFARKTIERKMKQYRMRLAFEQERTHECFRQSKDEKSLQFCKQQMRDQITQYQKDFVNTLKQL